MKATVKRKREKEKGRERETYRQTDDEDDVRLNALGYRAGILGTNIDRRTDG